MSLTGKVVVVTGAGRGLGAATVRQLTSLGARVVAGDIRKDWLDVACEDARSAGGPLCRRPSVPAPSLPAPIVAWAHVGSALFCPELAT